MKDKSSDSQHLYTNALINESSPYLLQHAHNPVNWYPWGEEALQKAKEEEKMLLISVGYSACHWCHVMEHESFEDTTVARIMNENFVCIKVDREERPDVDDVYMTACQLASGRGCGWPLNAFALSDGRPVWAGTYFPKEQWMNIIDQFGTMQKEDQSRLLDAADKITKGIAAQGTIEVNTEKAEFSQEDIEEAIEEFLSTIDPVYGGRNGAPKFPLPNNYELLLKYYEFTGDNKALQAVNTTLTRMANGGIYDQLGGGFSRYSVDEQWLAPHFEKMLYDNGQLISLYSHAFQITKNPLYEKVIRESIDWANREMKSSKGAYFASLDADSEGEEGKFYVWQEDEVDAILSDSFENQIFKSYFDISNDGNWEHKNILFHKGDARELAFMYNITDERLNEIINKGRSLLFKEREKRERPGLDDKVLSSWNGLMITGLIDAYKALKEEAYLQNALDAAQFIVDVQLSKDYRLQRNYKDGTSAINAFLDDYAATIQAFISIYQVTLDKVWLDRAKGMQQYVDTHFTNEEHGMYNYTSDLDPPLITRKSELTDNVIPSSSSMTARNLFILGHYLYKDDYIDQARQMLNNMASAAIESKQVSYYSNWLQLYIDMIYPVYEIAIIGPEAVEKALEFQTAYLPNALVLGSTGEENLKLLEYKNQEGKTMIYVCQNKACKMPTEDLEKARGLMQ
jgi:uncharacterized protein YyaL (SSP411 family)